MLTSYNCQKTIEQFKCDIQNIKLIEIEVDREKYIPSPYVTAPHQDVRNLGIHPYPDQSKS